MLDLSDLPASAQTQINRLLAEAELAFSTAPEWETVENRPGDQLVIIGPVLPAARDPERFVLNVFAQIGSILCETAQQRSWSGETLRRHADRILDQLISDTHGSKHVNPEAVPLSRFRTDVRHELQRRPVWLELQQTIRDRSVESTLGQQLKALRDKCGWSTAELARRMKMNRTAVEDNLEDRTLPHADNLSKYRTVFGTELKRPIVLDLPRNTSKHH